MGLATQPHTLQVQLGSGPGPPPAAGCQVRVSVARQMAHCHPSCT